MHLDSLMWWYHSFFCHVIFSRGSTVSLFASHCIMGFAARPQCHKKPNKMSLHNLTTCISRWRMIIPADNKAHYTCWSNTLGSKFLFKYYYQYSLWEEILKLTKVGKLTYFWLNLILKQLFLWQINCIRCKKDSNRGKQFICNWIVQKLVAIIDQ